MHDDDDNQALLASIETLIASIMCTAIEIPTSAADGEARDRGAATDTFEAPARASSNG